MLGSSRQRVGAGWISIGEASVEETLQQSANPLAGAELQTIGFEQASPSAGHAATGVARKGSLAKARALIGACRPKQWSKNVLLLAAPAAAGVLTKPGVAGEVALAFVAFCLLSSSTYLLNDVHDRAEDARHPRKRTRAVAAGDISVPLAVSSALVLAIGGLGLAAAVRPALAGMGAGYLALTATYTLWWRSVAVADIAGVAAGFVVRALAGGVAVDVPLSRWFVIVTSFGALFLVAGKRYAELVGSGRQPRQPTRSALSSAPERDPSLASERAQSPSPEPGLVRASLRDYSPSYLRLVMILAAAVTVGAYCLWAFQPRGGGTSLWYDLTILPFVLWLLRYALLVDRGGGEAPEDLVLGDAFLLVMSLAWALIFAGAVYVGG
jgi:decaprenyl-phosphate phosphoribosyltransferase